MLLAQLGERGLIQLIQQLVRKGKLIADFDEDAAIFRLGEISVALTTDMGAISTHFTTANPRQIGKKIITSGVTDLLAKGALPLYALTCFGFPRNLSTSFVRKLYISMDKELKRYGAYLVGGDTNEANELIYSIVMIGRIPRNPLKRSAAKVGDYVVITGEVGNAAAGYLMAREGLNGPLLFRKAQNEPELDFELCKKLMKSAHAGIDVSDGLAFELGELSRLSKKKIVIEFEKLPINPKLVKFCERNGLNLNQLIFHMGEDYQIVYTMPKPAGIVIGRVERGEGVFLKKNGRIERLETRGYEHFVSKY